jgi:tetratricopeptide (TPR) repeat protein
VSGGIKPAAPAAAASPGSAVATVRSLPAGPVDPELAAEFADRRARAAVLKVEGPRMLQAGNWRRAAELCGAWTNLDFGNADAWRCLGQALQAQGYHQDAINAFRKAKQYDPGDRTLDAAIDRSQKGIVADFLNRNRR